MINWLIGRAKCLTGKHERSKRLAKKEGDEETFTSVCVYCKVPMKRLRKRHWIVDTEASARPK